MSQLYFAYGSNLSTVALAEFEISATKISNYELTNYQLTYHKLGERSEPGTGKCTIHTAEGFSVHGVIYEITETDSWKNLDRKEGFPVSYTKLELDHSNLGPVITYQAHPTKIVAGLVPSQRYESVVVSGALEHGLPEEYINTWLRVRP